MIALDLTTQPLLFLLNPPESKLRIWLAKPFLKYYFWGMKNKLNKIEYVIINNIADADKASYICKLLAKKYNVNPNIMIVGYKNNTREFLIPYKDSDICKDFFSKYFKSIVSFLV